MAFEKHQEVATTPSSSALIGGQILSQAKLSDFSRPATSGLNLPPFEIAGAKPESASKPEMRQAFMVTGDSIGMVGTPNGNLATGSMVDGKLSGITVYRPDGTMVQQLRLPAPKS